MIVMHRLASIPWPRGLCFVGTTLYAIARGRPRGEGGPDPGIDDSAGWIYKLSLSGAASRIYEPSPSVFRLWDRSIPIYSDIETDRPYASLVWHDESQSFYCCGFSGIDQPTPTIDFRKNATDAIFRFHRPTKQWFEVERHDASVVVDPPTDRSAPTTGAIDNRFYPSDTATRPQGWLNGPNGLLIHDSHLFAVGKDNHSIIRYDLTDARRHPTTSTHLQGNVLRIDSRRVSVGGISKPKLFDSPSALATDGGSLYVGLRATNVVLRFPLSGRFDDSELVARVPDGYEIIDLVMSPTEELFVSTKVGKIWKVGPTLPYVATDANVYAALPGNGSNITIAADGTLFACCNDSGGAVYYGGP